MAVIGLGRGRGLGVSVWAWCRVMQGSEDPMRSPLRDDTVAREPRRFYSVAEVAQMFGMAQMTLYRAIHDGQFPAVKIRGRYVIPALALDAMEEAAVRTRAVVAAGDWAPDGAA
jgi:excisionase family DNA binding protein